MKSLQFGNLRVEETDTGIDFHNLEGVASVSQINTEEIPVLMNFLKRHLADSANRRSSWRLDLAELPDSELETLAVHVVLDGESLPVEPQDISLTGIRVVAEAAIAERGDQIGVRVSLGDHSASLVGIVVRQDSDMKRVAIHFPECIDSRGTLTPPDALWEIFTTLEQIWLDRKLGLQWS